MATPAPNATARAPTRPTGIDVVTMTGPSLIDFSQISEVWTGSEGPASAFRKNQTSQRIPTAAAKALPGSVTARQI
jgi:hypothetical protein